MKGKKENLIGVTVGVEVTASFATRSLSDDETNDKREILKENECCIPFNDILNYSYNLTSKVSHEVNLNYE